MQKSLKKIKTNKEIESLLKQDLSPYIHTSNFKQMRFELKPKNKTITFRISKELLKTLKQKAKKQGVHYQKLMRQALENFL